MEDYLVRLVFEVSIDGNHDHFDAQLRLFREPDETSALEKGHAYAREEEGTFINRAGNTVTWRFAGITFLKPLAGVNSGSLLESRSIKEDMASYREYVSLVDSDIRSKTLSLA